MADMPLKPAKTNHVYLVFPNKKDLALNELQ